MSTYEYEFRRDEPARRQQGQVEANGEHEAYQAALREIAGKSGSEVLNGKDGQDYTLVVSMTEKA